MKLPESGVLRDRGVDEQREVPPGVVPVIGIVVNHEDTGHAITSLTVARSAAASPGLAARCAGYAVTALCIHSVTLCK
jgi:hypothetical protein